MAVKEQIISYLEKLSVEQQKQVLEFTTSLIRPRGEPGIEIIYHAHELNFPPEDLAEMQHIIEEDCETTNPDDWELPA